MDDRTEHEAWRARRAASMGSFADAVMAELARAPAAAIATSPTGPTTVGMAVASTAPASFEELVVAGLDAVDGAGMVLMGEGSAPQADLVSTEKVAGADLASVLRPHAPNAVTLLGHGLTIWWILGGPFVAGAVGLLCDDLDGWLARKLDAKSEYGALYDWAVDVTLCSVMLAELGILPLAAVLVPVQVYRHMNGPPVAPLSSMRAFLTGTLALSRAGAFKQTSAR